MNEALRSLEGRLIDAQEHERRRLSRELHDGVGQRIALLSAELAALREMVAGSPSMVERVSRLLTRAEDVCAELHRVCQGLDPLSLLRLGLVASIQRVCTELSDVHRTRIHLRLGSLPDRIDQATALCLYRIVSEALCNVVKHSHAATAVVRLDAHRDEILLDVVDDGDGFDPTVAHASNGLGLVNMRERAAQAGGQLTLVVKPGQGTRVEARIPVR